MKKTLLLLTCALTSLLTNAQNLNFEWATQMHANNATEGKFIAADAWGNVYTLGHFSGTIDLKPGVGTANKISNGGDDIFISKLDAAGNFIWGKKVGSTGTDWPLGLKIDADGSLYYTGVFEATVDFDPNAGIYHLDASNSIFGACAFVSKLDSAGNFVWANMIEGGWQSYATSITLDNANNVYVSGIFQGSVSFDGVNYIAGQSGNTNNDIYLAKYTTAGSLVWGKTIGKISGSAGEAYLKIDHNYNLFMALEFTDTLDINPNTGVYNVITKSTNSSDLCITKFDSACNFIWAKTMGTDATHTGSISAKNIDVDGLGNIYVAGQVTDLVDFDPGIGVFQQSPLTAGQASTDMYVAKLNASGGFVWAKLFGGYGADNLESMVVDKVGNVYVTGDIVDDARLDPNTATWTAYNGVSDIFILKLNTLGNHQWSSVMGDTQFQTGYSIFVSPKANVYVTGGFYTYGGPIDFDPTVGVSGMQSTNSNTEIFIIKLCDSVASPLNTTPIANTTICTGNSTILSVLGAGTTTWYATATGSVSIGTGATFTTPVLTANTTYYVETSSCNAIATRTAILVTVNQAPTVTITGINTICAGNATTLTASGASTYLWTQGGTTTATKTVSPTATTTYTVTGTSANGCIANASTTVNINGFPLPTISISGLATICTGTSTTLTASGASAYVWSTGGTTATKTVSPTSSTTYTVTGTDVNGCYASSSKLITVNPLPTIAITGASAICTGTSTILTAGGGTSYVWGTGATTATNSVSPTSTTTYSVTGTNANGCVNTASKLVTVNPLPTIAITGASAICTGTSTTLTAGGGTSYVWGTGATTATNSVSPTSTTTYSVTGTNANGCVNTASKIVTVNPLPVVTINLTAIDTVCVNASVITLLGTATPSGGTWLGAGVTSPNFNASNAGLGAHTITYSYTNGNNCTNTTTGNIYVDGCNTVGISAKTINELTSIYPNPNNGSFTINVPAQGTYSIVNELGQIIRMFTINASTNYSITITDLASGIYTLQGINEGNITRSKIIVTQ